METANERVLGIVTRQGHSVHKHHSPDKNGEFGDFRFYFDDGRWDWSPQAAILHGYRPGTVAPGIALVLSHVHPGD